MYNQPDIVVLGDINLDSVASGNLPFSFAELRENGVITWRAIEDVPGGAGLNFARYCRASKWNPLLIGCVGKDASAIALRQWLGGEGIAFALQDSDTHSTGKAFIVRDASDVRLLINSTPNANSDLSYQTVDEQSEVIKHATVLYVSGYCLKDPQVPRFGATLRAMELAKTSGNCSVVFDVVPHRIYEQYTFDAFLGLTRSVDILISEVATMRRFIGAGSRSEEVDEAMAVDTMNLVRAYYPGCILRYGPSGCDMEILSKQGEGMLTRATGHAEATEKRGFGDRIAVEALTSYFRKVPHHS